MARMLLVSFPSMLCNVLWALHPVHVQFRFSRDFKSCTGNTAPRLCAEGCINEIKPIAAGGSSAVATIAPVMHHQDIQVAVVGLTNMLNGGGAIVGCSWQDSQSSQSSSASNDQNSSNASAKLDLIIKGHGSLLLHSNCKPSSVKADSSNVPFEYDQAKGKVVVSLEGQHLQQHVAVSW